MSRTRDTYYYDPVGDEKINTSLGRKSHMYIVLNEPESLGIEENEVIEAIAEAIEVGVKEAEEILEELRLKSLSKTVDELMDLESEMIPVECSLLGLVAKNRPELVKIRHRQGITSLDFSVCINSEEQLKPALMHIIEEIGEVISENIKVFVDVREGIYELDSRPGTQRVDGIVFDGVCEIKDFVNGIKRTEIGKEMQRFR